jgi:RNA polymerase sigma-70 factor (ECF subfamily)
MAATRELSDEALMLLVARGEQQAVATLYDRHAGLALALAYRVVGDRGVAEEIVQESFVALWRNVGSYRPDLGSVKTWLLTIARNRAISRVRRPKGVQPDEPIDDLQLADRAPDPLEQAEATVRREAVQRALVDLPSDQRTVLELGFFSGLTHQEIATRLGLPLGTVKGRMRLAMDKLRISLADYRLEAPA